MKLLVIILSLLSEHSLIHAISYQRFTWFDSYCAFIKKKTDRTNSYDHPALTLAWIVLPLLLLVTLVYFLACSLFWGIPDIIVQMAVFYYCLGPKNPFYPSCDQNKEQAHDCFISTYLAQVNNQLFAVIFWYVVAGPIAALFFRLISLTQNDTQVGALAIKITDLLEWVPCRITAIVYLFVGNFQAGFKQFRAFFLEAPDRNHMMLSQCALLAMQSNNAEEDSMPAAEQLVEHALVALLVLVALGTLVSWLK